MAKDFFKPLNFEPLNFEPLNSEPLNSKLSTTFNYQL